MKTLLVHLLCVVVFAAARSEIETEACDVRAWVRAEDLSPNHVSHGELRIKVPRAQCAHNIASVTLRLQLDEFGEYKFLKKGANLPEVETVDNQTAPSGYADYVGSDVVYDYQAHDNAMSDPELWVVRAEERRAWTTEATLLDYPDVSQPVVIPFTVAVPAVNYPPVITRYRQINSDSPISRHAFSDLGYRYIAVVTFTDRRIVEVPAGHTAFVPASHASATKTPFTWNATFYDPEQSGCPSHDPATKKRTEEMEKCLPVGQRSQFTAEITLEEGNIVQKGRLLKGRAIIHSKSGLTTMFRVSANLKTVHRDHWAQAQAAVGGDLHFYNATSPTCRFSGGDQVLDLESSSYSWIFDSDDEDGTMRWASHRMGAEEPLTPAHPYIDFELQVPQDMPTDFVSYYTKGENLLELQLSVIYPQEVANCLKQPHTPEPVEDELTADEAAKTEEGMWDSHTRVGQPASSYNMYHRMMRLSATAPIVVVRDSEPASPISHYLTSGLPMPVMRVGSRGGVPEFPIAEPVVKVESPFNTSARLMQSGSSDPYKSMQQFMNMSRAFVTYPDPAKDYRGGNYVGLLWKKKLVAEERGILPLTAASDEGANGQQEVLS
ncbi:hypothetical protein C8R43DRAFT_1018130 [Mycena crocata]|nr:hypothetical protein C8R43DRAFT_1018130 [Mycena crocata]